MSTRTKHAVIALTLVLLTVAAGTAPAQPPARQPVFGTGPSYRTWDLETDAGTQTINQYHVPFSQSVPFGHSFDILAYGAWASTTLDFGNGDEAKLEGFTDLRMKGVWRPTPRAQLSVGVNLPVGKETLHQGAESSAAAKGRLRALHDGEDHSDDREIEVAQAMWSPILGFRTKTMGSGFDVELGAGYAAPLSRTVMLGVSAAWLARGEYDLFDTADGITTFTPGAEGSASIGLDWNVSPGTLLRLDLTGRTFGQDASNGNDVYQTGTQFEIDATFARATPSWTLLLRGRNVTRSDDEIISGAGDDLVRTIVTAPGSLWGFAEAYYLLSPASALGAELHAGTFGEAETYLSDGSSIGVGPAFRLGRIDARRVLVRALYLTGDAEGGTIDLSGFDVSIAAAFPF